MLEVNSGLLSIFLVASGLLFVTIGVYFLMKGRQAKATVRSSLLDENIVVGDEGTQSGELVRDADTALAQASLIKEHTRANYGRFSDMTRGDPKRDNYTKALVLQTALNLAVLSFGVANLAMGIGYVLVLVGALILGAGATIPLLAN